MVAQAFQPVPIKAGETPAPPNIGGDYILRRYLPPTSYSTWVIWPRLATLTVSINSAKILPPLEDRLFQGLEAGRGRRLMPLLKVIEIIQLGLFLFIGGAGQLRWAAGNNFPPGY